MAYLVGVILAFAVCLFATWVGFDKDRVFYPTVMVVIASYYLLFAVMGGSTHALLVESAVMLVFLGVSVLGFRRGLWFVVVAFFAHGAFDFIHGRLIVNPGVPVWWPMFCLTFDVAAGGYLAWLLMRRSQSRLRSTCS